ncbi:hypothetical protein AB0D08_32405 [Kitasatospora sp. NPDC048540]|uniref:hypothetical protein n=1 Tax=Kitasatospora sp. NPDC048540 TaxID=3155634 RepID=UPI003405F413
MNASTLVALWKDPAARAGSDVRHPAGEIRLTAAGGPPAARRAHLLTGLTGSATGTSQETMDTTTSEITVTSLSFH